MKPVKRIRDFWTALEKMANAPPAISKMEISLPGWIKPILLPPKNDETTLDTGGRQRHRQINLLQNQSPSEGIADAECR